jgi:hypothetical protein
MTKSGLGIRQGRSSRCSVQPGRIPLRNIPNCHIDLVKARADQIRIGHERHHDPDGNLNRIRQHARRGDQLGRRKCQFVGPKSVL